MGAARRTLARVACVACAACSLSLVAGTGQAAAASAGAGHAGAGYTGAGHAGAARPDAAVGGMSAPAAGAPPRIVDIAPAWAANSVNAVVFRKNSLATADGWQYAAFYDQEHFLVLARRKSGASEWEIRRTPYRGSSSDAHNAISIMADAEGFLHVAWDHHNSHLRYARGVAPGSLELDTPQPMTGQNETRVTYPEFHRLPDGGLLFLYRDGGSGNGNLVVNRYAGGIWHRVHSNLIDGEGKRNAYWQAFVDGRGTIHLSWVWRESPDVASNHDIAYARSRDGGKTWERSDGKPYVLPITAASAEYAARVPQKHELINQTSMSADAQGRPYIATYWREEGSKVPQYRIVYLGDSGWVSAPVGARTTPFTLGGGGTKKIPIARPQILIGSEGQQLLVFRDEERGSRATVAVRCSGADAWQLRDLTAASVGDWEPSYDTELWRMAGELDLFLLNVTQGDGERVSGAPPQMARVLEWRADCPNPGSGR
ncbi:BNR repeat-containing protein [Pseudoduganella sp. RAF19]|uniref:BNR repeat-containing protein n=2 Tax=unclassified Pseudoduganella TaxID=2637179 RepID=UPI003F974C9D